MVFQIVNNNKNPQSELCKAKKRNSVTLIAAGSEV